MQRLKTILIFILIIAVIIAGLFLIGEVRSYTNYTVEGSSEHIDAKSTRYESFGSYLIKYGNDGITCVDKNDNKIWNQSYEMDDPILAMEGEYLAVGDHNDRQLYIFSTAGYEGKVDTVYSILQIDIAENGTTAAVLENKGIYYLCLYDKAGNEVAKGTIHLENSGYPLSMALSDDGIKMAVSFLNVSEGSVKTTLTFYNFASVGQNEIDNIVTSDTYEATVIPKVVFLDKNTCIAFADDQILIYTGNQKPSLDSNIETGKEISSIFYGKDIFGYVTKNDYSDASADAKDAEVTGAYQMNAFSSSGRRIFSKGFDLSYTSIQVLEDGEVCILGDARCQIFSRYGLQRFYYEFDESVKLIRSTGSFGTYDFIFEEHTDSVRLS